MLSIVTRGARFFALSAVLSRYGAWIKAQLERHLYPIAIGAVALIALGFLGFRYLL